MTNDQFFQFRCTNEVTSVEIADYLGSSVKLMLDVETAREAVKSFMIKAVIEIAKARGQ